ncbi:MAG: tRNA (N6-isopentenyl adenosine(37)-C2)-methylthiotransferase MiaB [Pseudomonadota bacterium]
MQKNIYIKTYGCQMNVYDSEQMVKLLKPHGYQPIDAPSNADLVILNTCHIREKAAEKVYSDLGRIKILRDKRQDQTGKKMLIAVAGCVGQAEGEEIFKRAPFVDIVVGSHSYTNLPELISKIKREKSELIDLEFQENYKFDKLMANSEQKSSVSSFLSVQEGCDKFCTFCVVPYTRGKEFSRPVEEIISEAQKLVANGAKELTLLGQNVNAYHGVSQKYNRQFSFAELMEEISHIDGLIRIRYTTSHPKDMHDALYEIHGKNEKIMPYLHLPVQSGSNNILRTMNRKHSRETYFKIIDKLRQYRPDIALSSDFIVGFPGEKDEDFADTIDLVNHIGYSQCYSFKYSPRPGTVAANMDNQVPEDVKSERLKILQDLLNKQQLEFNKKLVDKQVKILFDRKGKYENQYVGRTEYMQSVHVTNNKLTIGTLSDVKITDAHANSLTGIIA